MGLNVHGAPRCASTKAGAKCGKSLVARACVNKLVAGSNTSCIMAAPMRLVMQNPIRSVDFVVLAIWPSVVVKPFHRLGKEVSDV